MKKLSCALLVVIIFILASCSRTFETGSTNSPMDSSANGADTTEAIYVSSEASHTAISEANYISTEANYRSYANSQELVEDADIVLIGKVTGISFQMLDMKTGQPPTERTERVDRRIHTIYDISTVVSYKGNAAGPTQLMIYGGLKGYRVDEQLEMIKDANAFPDNGIIIQQNIPEIKIGETYLFALHQTDRGICLNLIPDQSIYNLHNPFEKHTLGSYELENPAKYYNAETDQYGSPIISAKDVIEVFGEERWDSFWTQWQKDNPKWETWLHIRNIFS